MQTLVYHTCLPHFTINLAAKITPPQFLYTVLKETHRESGGAEIGEEGQR